MRSEVTSEKLFYVFPWQFMSHLSNVLDARKKSTTSEEKKDPQCMDDEEADDECEASEQLKRIVTMMDDEAVTEKMKGGDKGAQAFKLDDGNVIFVTQAASYLNRVPNFKDYFLIDFFLVSCILLSLPVLSFHAVIIFANLMCLFSDTCFDMLTCMSISYFCNFVV